MLLLVRQVTINMDDLGVTPLPGSELDTQQLFAGADIDTSIVYANDISLEVVFNSDEFVTSTPPNGNHTEARSPATFTLTSSQMGVSSAEESSLMLAASSATSINDKTPTGQHYKCSQCAATFSRRSSLVRHKKKHDGASMVQCAYPSCLQSFRDEYDLRIHTMTNHQSVTFDCDTCDKSFKTKFGLARHAQDHTGDRKYKCQTCEHGFTCLRDYGEHINVHNEIKPHRCSRCQAEFSRNRDLEFHMSVCGKDAAIACEICGKRFKCRKYMIDHMHVHTSPCKYQCSHCGKNYGHRASLKNHEMRKHSTL